jgi:hypothetical protein
MLTNIDKLFANTASTHINLGSILEDVVHMIPQSVHVHWQSNVFTGAVNACQARVTPALPWMYALQ